MKMTIASSSQNHLEGFGQPLRSRYHKILGMSLPSLRKIPSHNLYRPRHPMDVPVERWTLALARSARQWPKQSKAEERKSPERETESGEVKTNLVNPDCQRRTARAK